MSAAAAACAAACRHPRQFNQVGLVHGEAHIKGSRRACVCGSTYSVPEKGRRMLCASVKLASSRWRERGTQQGRLPRQGRVHGGRHRFSQGRSSMCGYGSILSGASTREAGARPGRRRSPVVAPVLHALALAVQAVPPLAGRHLQAVVVGAAGAGMVPGGVKSGSRHGNQASCRRRAFASFCL